MLLANFNGKEHLRHRAVSLRQHGFLVYYCCYSRAFIRIFSLYFDLVQMRSVILCNKRICMYMYVYCLFFSFCVFMFLPSWWIKMYYNIVHIRAIKEQCQHLWWVESIAHRGVERLTTVLMIRSMASLSSCRLIPFVLSVSWTATVALTHSSHTASCMNIR